MEEIETKKSANIFIGLAITIVCVILVGIFVIRPLFRDNSLKEKIIEAKRTNLSILKDKESKLSELSSKKDEIEENTRKVLAALPEHQDKARLLVQFEGLASRSNIYLKGATEEATGTSSEEKVSNISSGISEISYNLRFTGTYNDFKNFLINAQKALRILRINKIELKPASEGGNYLDISVNLSAFFKPQEGELNEATE